jgi:hypothetical protein
MDPDSKPGLPFKSVLFVTLAIHTPEYNQH